MLQTVDIAPRRLDDYRPVIGPEAVDELRALAAPLRGARVLQVNATPYGGGVSELLRSLVPLQRDLGLIADWKIISGDEAFFDARCWGFAGRQRPAGSGGATSIPEPRTPEPGSSCAPTSMATTRRCSR